MRMHHDAMSMDLPTFWSFNRRFDAHRIATRTLTWSGPHAWPGYGNADSEVPAGGGVYLTTFAHEDGFILRSAGVSTAIRRRLRQHEYEFLMGRYTVLDPEAARQGVRRELWHGWSYARSHPEQRDLHLPQIQQWARAEMAACRLFVGQRLHGDEHDMDARLRERIEFAIIHAAYASRQPWGDLVDGGMHLSGRFTDEMPIRLLNQCSVRLYGLPPEMEI